MKAWIHGEQEARDVWAYLVRFALAGAVAGERVTLEPRRTERSGLSDLQSTASERVRAALSGAAVWMM